MWYAFGTIWEMDEKVAFDGATKRIYVNSGVTSIDIKADVYSGWKRWAQLYDHGKFPPAFRAIGGDSVGSGQYAGDLYFLINGWKLFIDVKNTRVSGVLYSDDFDTGYYDIDTESPIYPVSVSSIVNAISTGGAGASASEIWNYNNRTITQNIPTATQIRQEIDSNSTRLSNIQSSISALPDAIRSEIQPELTKIMLMESGLTETQAVMLSEIYKLYGLDPTKPLIVTHSHRTAGDIVQEINSNASGTTITRL